MKVIDEGHLYQLESMDKTNDQSLQFIYKDKDDNGKFVTVIDGTTNEEVLNVLINRIEYLNNKLPCRENRSALDRLKSALGWLNQRTRNREEQGVENSPLPHEDEGSI
jgi:hypothetical protein